MQWKVGKRDGDAGGSRWSCDAGKRSCCRTPVPENVARIPWLVPDFAQPDGILLMSIHSLVVESQGRKILV